MCIFQECLINVNDILKYLVEGDSLVIEVTSASKMVLNIIQSVVENGSRSHFSVVLLHCSLFHAYTVLELI